MGGTRRPTHSPRGLRGETPPFRNERGDGGSHRRVWPRHRRDLRVDGAVARHHLQRHADAELRAGRDADDVHLRRVGGPAGARVAAGAHARGGRPRRRRPGLARGARDHPAGDRRHPLGRPHHHRRTVARAARRRRTRVDARRVPVPVVLPVGARRGRARAPGPRLARDPRRLARADGGAVDPVPVHAAGPRDARGGAEPARGAAHGDQCGARVLDVVGAGRRGRRGGRRAGGTRRVPVQQDGAHRHQRLHGGGDRRLRLDARRRGGRHVPRRAREPGAAQPAVGHPLFRAVRGAHRHPGRAPRGSRGARRAEKGVRARRAWPAIVLAALAVWPWVAPRYFVFLASLVLVNVVVAIGLNLLSGYTNQLSFGHAGFLAIGAYVAALVTIHAPAMPVVITLLLAGVLTAAVGLAFGVPCLRLGGLYLSMATLAFGFVITEAILNLDTLTKGADGLRVPALRLGGFGALGDTGRYHPSAVSAR